MLPNDKANPGQRRLFFVSNQDILNGSAHGFYCFNNCWSLAAANSESEVRLVIPKRHEPAAISRHFGRPPLPNLRIDHVPSIRKTDGGFGLTLSGVFHHFAKAYLKRHVRSGDIVIASSAPKLFQFLARHRQSFPAVRLVYEVHQLALKETPDRHKDVAREREVLAAADRVVTTTQALRQMLEHEVPGTPLANLGLACSFDPSMFDPPDSNSNANGKPFRLGYVGSLYPEQGIDWLAGQWGEVRKRMKSAMELHVFGATSQNSGHLKKVSTRSGDSGIVLHPRVEPSALPASLSNIHALVIPALSKGRMPYVAITKAYDYLGMKRPTVASNLPSINEVMHDGREALLFQPREITELVNTLERLQSDSALRSCLVDNAVKRSRELGWPTRARRYWDFLDEPD